MILPASQRWTAFKSSRTRCGSSMIGIFAMSRTPSSAPGGSAAKGANSALKSFGSGPVVATPEACRVVNCHLEAEYSDRAETKYGYELARIMTRPIVNLTIEIVGLLLEGLARLEQRPDRSRQLRGCRPPSPHREERGGSCRYFSAFATCPLNCAAWRPAMRPMTRQLVSEPPPI